MPRQPVTVSDSINYYLLKPDVVPVGNMVTDSRCNFGLAPGETGLRTNFRVDGKQARVRAGITQLIAKPGAATSMADLWCGELNGVYYLVGIFLVGAKYAVYFTSSATNFAAWTEATSTAGHCGDTRLTNWYPGQNFAAVKVARYAYWGNYGSATVSQDVLLIQSGADKPLIFDPGTDISTIGSTTTTYCFFQEDLSTGTPFGDQTSLATFSKYYQIRTAANKSRGASGAANIFPTAVGPPAINQAAFTLDNSAGGAYVAANSNVVVSFVRTGAAVSGSIAAMHIDASDNDYSGPGLYFVVEAGTSVSDLNTMLANCAIEVAYADAGGAHTNIYNNVANWTTIYDPTSTDPSLRGSVVRPTVDLDPSNKRFVFWVSTSGLPTCNWIRFINRAVNTTAFSLFILNVCVLGYCPGGTTFGASCENYFAYTESPGTIVTASAPETLNNLGGPTLVNVGASTAAPPSIVEDTKCRYVFNIRLWNPYYGIATTTGSLGSSPTAYCIYAKLPKGDGHYFAGRYTVATPSTTAGSATWTSTNSSRTTVTGIIGDGFSTPLTDLSVNRELPSAFQQVTPRGRICTFANGRLFVGYLPTTSLGEVAVSGAQPFRFQEIPIGNSGGPEPQLGSYIHVGPTTVQAFTTMGANFEGASNVYALTSTDIYKIGLPLGTNTGGDGLASGAGTIGVLQQPLRVGRYGTLAPRSIVEDRGVTYWLSRFGKYVRMTSEGVEDISWMSVEDRFRNIPAGYVQNTQAAFAYDRLFIAATPTGETTNKKCLVFHTRQGPQGIWESEDVPSDSSIRYDFLVTARSPNSTGSGTRIFAGVRSTGTVWELESGTTDNGTATTFSIATGELASPFIGRWFYMHEALVSCDKDAAHSLSAVATYYPSGASQPAKTISLVDARNAAWPRVTNLTTMSSGTGINASGDSAVISFSGTVTSGTVFREVTVITKVASPKRGRR